MISDGTFLGCPISYESEGGVLYLGNYAMGYETSWQNSNLVIREGTTTVSSNAFSTFSGSIQLPSTLVGLPSFSNHQYLQRVILPEGIESIPRNMFRGCSNLVEVTIPTSVKSIGYFAFNGCNQLLQIENGVSYVGKWAISADATLTSVTLRADTVGIAEFCFWRSAITSIDLPEGLRYISEIAFMSCTGLTELTIPASVEYIGGNPLHYCSNVSRVVVADGNTAYHVANGFLIETATKTVLWGLDPRELPTDGSVTAIKEAFAGMSYRLPEITELVLPESIVRIDTEAFCDATALVRITLSGDLEYIGLNVFYGCEALTDIDFGGTMAEWEAVEKSEHWIQNYHKLTIHCTDGDIVIGTSN